MITFLRCMKIVVTSIFLVIATTGCVALVPPNFQTPARWQGGQTFPTTEITLQDQDRSQVTDFPQGVTRADDAGRPCLDVSSPDRYTGGATWRSLDAYSVQVRFEDSDITISSGPAFLGSQDWTELRWKECDTGQIWALGAVQ